MFIFTGRDSASAARQHPKPRNRYARSSTTSVTQLLSSSCTSLFQKLGLGLPTTAEVVASPPPRNKKTESKGRGSLLLGEKAYPYVSSEGGGKRRQVERRGSATSRGGGGSREESDPAISEREAKRKEIQSLIMKYTALEDSRRRGSVKASAADVIASKYRKNRAKAPDAVVSFQGGGGFREKGEGFNIFIYLFNGINGYTQLER